MPTDPSTASRARTRGPLQPAELAEAVVLADVSLGLTVVGQVVPFGSVLLIAAVVPLAVVAARHRLRAVVAGALAASVVGFLVIGSAALTSMAGCAAFGALVGAADRRGWGRGRTMFTGLAVLWPPIALLVDLVLFVFSDLRRLVLENVRNGWRGLLHLFENVGLVRVADAGNRAVDWVVRNWWLSIPIALFFMVWFGVWLAEGLATPALRRIRVAFAHVTDDAPPVDAGDGPPAPVPARVEDVHVRYPGATTDALAGVSVEVDAGEMLAVVGENGSGKSTLSRVIAGRRLPDAGSVQRPGPVGLGHVGGTAMVFQRPEAQVLGVRVRDDVVWGLADPSAVDVDAVLERVGLQEFADRETATLSGGELQRLAIAAAVARAPRLFVSDESTAMVDTAGRTRIVSLLHDLAHDDGMAVVHVTHHEPEAAVADRTLTLAHGHVVGAVAEPNGSSVPAPPPRLGAPALVLRGVGHVYSRGTPWAHRALTGVDLTIHDGEGVLVVGHNGSGKSTLAWILAGLLVPSEGTAQLDGELVASRVGRVGLSFQHARLQLLRPTVLEDVRAAGGVDDATARGALEAVGLDAARIGARRIDELSGGQTRRAVLAGVLASRPRAIVLDEPFAGLDPRGRRELHALLADVRRSRGIALIVVSHDPDVPAGLVDRVIELDRGRIARDEPVDAVAEGELP